MTSFINGPAQGKVLSLLRAPYFLRVVEENGKFDALDQELDKPKPTEKIYVYEWVSKPGYCHVRAASRAASGFRAIADYQLHAVQPTDDIVRDNVKWRAWCDANVEGKRRYDKLISEK